MNKLIIKNELKRNKKGLIIWIAVSVGVAAMIMAIFPFIEKLMQKMMEQMRPMYESMNMELPENFMQETNAVSYFTTQVASLYQLASLLFAALIGISAWSKEETGMTAEFLLTTPVKRETVWKSKLISVVTVVAIYGVIFSIASFIITIIVSAISTSGIIWLDMAGLAISLVSLVLVQLMIAIFCFALTFFFKKSSSVGMAFIVVFGMVVLQLVIGLIGSAVETELGKDIIHALSYLSPFSFASPVTMVGLVQGVFKTTLSDLWYIGGFALIWIVVTILLTLESYKRFKTRDIPN